MKQKKLQKVLGIHQYNGLKDGRYLCPKEENEKKAVISDRIYLDVLPHQKKKIDDELTYAIPSFRYDDPPLVIKNMGTIREDLVTIPSGRTDLIPLDHDIKDKRITKPIEFPPFKF